VPTPYKLPAIYVPYPIYLFLNLHLRVPHKQANLYKGCCMHKTYRALRLSLPSSATWLSFCVLRRQPLLLLGWYHLAWNKDGMNQVRLRRQGAGLNSPT